LRKPDTGFSVAALAALLFDELRLPPGTRFKLAYSGGLDSHVLLHALAALRARHSCSVSAIYIDHGLQASATAWGEHCARTCAQLDVAFVCERIEVSAAADHGLEAAARRARYQALRALLAPGEMLLTAHHRNDQAETVLLQLLRGAGVAGLAAMPVSTAFGAGELLRPLLGFTRAALHAYALEHRLHWIEDPSNRDARLRRNFLRAEILPRLATHWPEADGMLARTARYAAETLELLDEVGAQDFSRCRQATEYSAHALSVAAVARLSDAHQRNLLRYWLRQQGLRVPGTRTLNQVLAQLRHAPRSQHACVRWPDAEIWRYRDLLVAAPVQAAPDPALDVVWNLSTPLDLPGVGRLRTEPVQGHGLATARLDRALHIRLRRGGETLLLPGRRHHHALKKLLQAEGVSPWLRARLPLLYADNVLVAVADRWVCAPYAARPGEDGLAIVWEPALDRGRVSEKAR
jgi:tRNA(Ile)-lysidine synthase